MKIYLVGGAVRDELLGRDVKEQDWVVVGSTEEEMLSLGYTPVGKDFPVYLHPETKDEYALARKERKVAKGYKGFECDFDPSVTLEEDLLRRDLTINAMAKTPGGEIIDPYHGQQDLKAKILRHISPAFAEDPVRILRVARFAARYPEFNVADETNVLMHAMVDNGEVDALVSERVWKEFEKALNEVAPQRFIEVLKVCGALQVLFPALMQQDLNRLARISRQSDNMIARFTVLMMGDKEDALEQVANGMKLPKHLYDMTNLVLSELDAFKEVQDKKSMLDLFYLLDAFRREERFDEWLEVANAVTSLDGDFQDQYDKLLSTFRKVKVLQIPEEEFNHLQGKAIADYIYQKRLSVM